VSDLSTYYEGSYPPSLWEEVMVAAGTTPAVEPEPVNPLDSMTKDQLIAYAGEHDVEVSTSWTKAEIRAAIDAADG
jgi:hypothetical protein